MLHTAVTLLVWPSYVSTAWLLPEATSNRRMWGLPAAASRRLSVVISSLLTCDVQHSGKILFHKVFSNHELMSS